MCIQFADIFHEKSCNRGVEAPPSDAINLFKATPPRLLGTEE